MMDTAESQFDLKEIKRELRRALWESSQRGLIQSVKWLSELNFSLKSITCDAIEPGGDKEDCDDETYIFSKSLFDCQEYDRAAYFSEKSSRPKTRFLHLYSRYMSSEKKRLDNMTEVGCTPDASKSKFLRELMNVLKVDYAAKKLDGYGLYLYGVVLKKLNLHSQAIEILEESVNRVPWLWCAWIELSSLLKDRETLESLSLPRHWILHFFLGHTYLEQKLLDDALEIYEQLKNNGFENFTYLNAQIAIIYHDNRDAESAIGAFKSIQQVDPYRLDNIDVYSHLLYVKEMKTELAYLAHKAVEIDKYRVETCCVIGNYYSLRSEHQKSVIYFQRALKLNPNYLSAWILMGHEFVELQNTNAAIQSYRQAIEVNRNDYRAWNGLGQTYEILGLNSYCIYYYARAAQQCPGDSRMLVALGEAFEKLDKITNAIKCYSRAHSVGDIEGMALLKLAKLYDKLMMRDSAAAAYSAACLEGEGDSERGLQEAHRYLAHYFLNKDQLDHAAQYANKCLDHEETKEEGKSLLTSISERRAFMEPVAGLDGAKMNESIEVSDSPITQKPSCAVALNYNTPSPAQLAETSRYKM